MKLSCATCLAKYSVPEEKVAAAVAEARCRKCGGSLVVRSDGGAADAPPHEATLAPAAEEDERRARRKQRDMFSPPALAEVADDTRLTGQRNDTSVLFSLGALSKEAQELERTPARGHAEGDGSGLIDIRALSAAHGTKAEIPIPTVDDLVNLGGAGLGGSPLLVAPPAEAPAPIEAREGKRGVWIAVAAGGLFFLGSVVLAIVATRPPAPSGPVASAPRSPVVERDPVIAPTAMPPVTVTAPHDPEPAKTTETKAERHTAPSKPQPTAKAEPVPVPPPPTVRAEPPPPPPATDRAPFNRGEASAALASVVVASCKKIDGPTGPGHVQVTFAPSGMVESAIVDQGAFVGTPVGGCVAGKFRAAHISPFAGGSVKVGKSFTL